MSSSCGCGGKFQEKKHNKFDQNRMISTRIGNAMLSIPSFICKGRKRRRRTEVDSVTLFHNSHFTITQISITGSAEPCTPLIAVGMFDCKIGLSVGWIFTLQSMHRVFKDWTCKCSIATYIVMFF